MQLAIVNSIQLLVISVIILSNFIQLTRTEMDHQTVRSEVVNWLKNNAATAQWVCVLIFGGQSYTCNL
jgi:hypothetical protein